MSPAAALADQIQNALPHIKRGSLRFFGEWFGRPHDNIHTLVRAADKESVLILAFDGGETLHVWEPDGATIGADTFRIDRAARVRWEWHFYGRPRTPENLYFLDYTVRGASVEGATNVDWYPHTFTASAGEPAVEIL